MIMVQAASSPPCHRVGEPSERPEESSGRHQRTEDLTGGKRNIVVQMSTSRNHYCPQLGRESLLSKCPQQQHRRQVAWDGYDEREERVYRRPPTYLIIASRIVRPSIIYQVHNVQQLFGRST